MKLSIITATYNRPQQLLHEAIPSIIKQTDYNFEWIVINDGSNLETRDIIRRTKGKIPIIYQEMEHPKTGFGLCYARNLGISCATGELITYLDDDNSLAPNFVSSVIRFFVDSRVKYSNCLQYRRRDVIKNGKTIRQGDYFISPQKCTITELVQHKKIFDSNGFVHYLSGCPKWNPEYKIYADYEYLLKCVDVWGKNAFKLNPIVLVNYIQSSLGVIGSSSYTQWAKELMTFCEHSDSYSVLQPEDIYILQQWIVKYQNKATQPIKAFRC